MDESRDFAWINKNYAELQSKYANMYVAVKDGKVVSADREFGKAYQEAKRKVGEHFVTDYIMSGEPYVLTYLRHS